ncbi:MAG: oxidoreductase, partial [Pirellulaceae bacterium]|nr:oxidoreductase [Pirellulaceae bacterium]
MKQTRSVSLRGVSVANRDVVWASGADGTVLRSVDRGQTITTILVPGAETSDFRDVHAFDAEHAS